MRWIDINGSRNIILFSEWKLGKKFTPSCYLVGPFGVMDQNQGYCGGGTFKAADFAKFVFLPLEYLWMLLPCLGGTVRLMSPSILGTPSGDPLCTLFIIVFLEPSPVPAPRWRDE